MSRALAGDLHAIVPVHSQFSGIRSRRAGRAVPRLDRAAGEGLARSDLPCSEEVALRDIRLALGHVLRSPISNRDRCAGWARSGAEKETENAPSPLAIGRLQVLERRPAALQEDAFLFREGLETVEAVIVPHPARPDAAERQVRLAQMID